MEIKKTIGGKSHLTKFARFIMNITDKKDKREIKQLWCAASYYFELAQKIKNELPDNTLLIKTVEKIADLCSAQCNINLTTCNNEKIMVLNDHLASCAIRLNTIDEILGRKYISNRWYFYEGLKNKTNLKKDDIKNHADKIIHCLLRHCVAHYEPDPASAKYKKTMDAAFKEFTIESLYKNIELVIEEIKKDILPVIQ